MSATYRKQLALAAAAATLIFSAAMAHATAMATPDITYKWTGDCLDCNHPLDTATPATATLRLHNYTPGTALTSTSQVISFQYDSLLYSLGTTTPFFVSGNIPAAGGAAAFDIKWLGGSQANDFYEFHTYPNGRWLFWKDFVPADMGTNSNFHAQAPEPATAVLLGLSLAGLGFSRRKQM